MQKSLTRSPTSSVLAMYAQVGDFQISRGPPTVPLTGISRNTFFLKSQNPHMRGPSVTLKVYLLITLEADFTELYKKSSVFF